jgi:hypothetical protein
VKSVVARRGVEARIALMRGDRREPKRVSSRASVVLCYGVVRLCGIGIQREQGGWEGRIRLAHLGSMGCEA